MVRRDRDQSAHPRIPAPAGLRAARLGVGGEEYLVLSHPLSTWELPAILTPAEREVVHALLRGASRAQIAEARGSSVRTVANLLAQAFRKLGVRSRVELAARLSAAIPADEAS
jgi:DNA-binding CsgD family transcriptional regulator